MTELLCIKTHSQGAVRAGNVYPMLGARKAPCCGRDEVNIGLLDNDKIVSRPIGFLITCPDCRKSYPKTEDDNFWWLHSSLFAQIGTEDECEQYREKVLIEK